MNSLSLMILLFKDLIEIWDNNSELCNITCSRTEGKNMINLIKNIPSNNFMKIIQIINIYLKSLNKKYMRSYHALDLFNYLKSDSNNYNVNILHLVYPLVRDYWNILEINGHSKISICYYNKLFDLYDDEKSFINRNINIDSMHFIESINQSSRYSLRPPKEMECKSLESNVDYN